MMKHIPYGHHTIEEDDINAVVEVLRSQNITTGPKVEEFEKRVSDYFKVDYAVAVSSGTAALHCALYALGVGRGDEVIVTAMTYVATVNAIIYLGATPVFADVDPNNLLIDILNLEKHITHKSKVIIAVDYAGQPCDYKILNQLARKYNINVLADACHSMGAYYHDKLVGGLADLTVFSMHPVKAITTGEGGLITTNNKAWANAIKRFRNHGVKTDYQQRQKRKTWRYDMVELGFNYRLTDIQCALGISQLGKLEAFVSKRQEIAKVYDKAFKDNDTITPLTTNDGVNHSYHLYVIRLTSRKQNDIQNRMFTELVDKGIGVAVHFKPVHLHSYYREKFHTHEGLCPVAEAAYEQILSLPIYPVLSLDVVNYVISTILELTVENQTENIYA